MRSSGKQCEGSGKFIGHAQALAAEGAMRLVANPAYVSASETHCPHCNRVVPVVNGTVARHNTYRLS